MLRAISAPTASHQLRSNTRCRVRRRPSPAATAQNTIVSLFSSPTPQTTPTAGHSRVSSVRTSRTTSHDASAQKTISRLTVLRKWLVVKKSGPSQPMSPASVWAGRPPPRSAVINAAKIT